MLRPLPREALSETSQPCLLSRTRLFPFRQLVKLLPLHLEMCFKIFFRQVHLQRCFVDVWQRVHLFCQSLVRVNSATRLVLLQRIFQRNFHFLRITRGHLRLDFFVRLAIAPLVVIPGVEMAGEIGGLQALVDDRDDRVVNLTSTAIPLHVVLGQRQRLLALLRVGAFADPDKHRVVTVEQHDVVFDEVFLVKVKAFFRVEVTLIVGALEQPRLGEFFIHRNAKSVGCLPSECFPKARVLGKLRPLHQDFWNRRTFDVPNILENTLGEVALFLRAAVPEPQIKRLRCLQDEAVARVERRRTLFDLNRSDVVLVRSLDVEQPHTVVIVVVGFVHVFKAGADATRVNDHPSFENEIEVRGLLVLHDAHLHGIAPHFIVQLRRQDRRVGLLVLRRLEALPEVDERCFLATMVLVLVEHDVRVAAEELSKHLVGH
eukprot:m.642329 g.642329  ORF g.642329 m.642329 type:complete len:431 (+) comp22639_c0_seq1:249-1541(+)